MTYILGGLFFLILTVIVSKFFLHIVTTSDYMTNRRRTKEIEDIKNAYIKSAKISKDVKKG